MSSISSSSPRESFESEMNLSPRNLRTLAIESAPGGVSTIENVQKGARILENDPVSQIHAENALVKGSTGTLGCILGPEPCPKVMPTLPLVPMASLDPGWDSPRDAGGVTKT